MVYRKSERATAILAFIKELKHVGRLAARTNGNSNQIG
jgi:hypothetical protein